MVHSNVIIEERLIKAPFTKIQAGLREINSISRLVTVRSHQHPLAGKRSKWSPDLGDGSCRIEIPNRSYDLW